MDGAGDNHGKQKSQNSEKYYILSYTESIF